MNTDGTGTGLNLNSKVSFDQATSKTLLHSVYTYRLHIHTDWTYILFCKSTVIILHIDNELVLQPEGSSLIQSS